MAKSNKKPSRMLEQIMEAIVYLREADGCTLKQITGHMHTIASANRTARKSPPLIKRALDQGVASGLLLRKSGKYKLALATKDYKIFKNFKDKSENMKDAVNKGPGAVKKRKASQKVPKEDEYSDTEDVPKESAVPTDDVREVRRRRRRRRRRSRRRRSRRSRSRGRKRAQGDDSDVSNDVETDSAGTVSEQEGQKSDPEDRGRRRRRRRRRSRRSRSRRRGKGRRRSHSAASDGENVSPLHSNVLIGNTRKSQERKTGGSRRNSRSSAHRDAEDYPHQYGERHLPPNCGDPDCLCNLGANNESSGHCEENNFGQN